MPLDRIKRIFVRYIYPQIAVNQVYFTLGYTLETGLPLGILVFICAILIPATTEIVERVYLNRIKDKTLRNMAEELESKDEFVEEVYAKISDQRDLIKTLHQSGVLDSHQANKLSQNTEISSPVEITGTGIKYLLENL